MKTYWVYMLLCVDGSFYLGVTNNLEVRVGQHACGIDRRCYTFTRRPVTLVYASDFREILDAISWEKQLKRWSHAKKAALVDKDWPRVSRLARNYWARHFQCHPEPASRCHPEPASRCHPEPVEG